MLCLLAGRKGWGTATRTQQGRGFGRMGNVKGRGQEMQVVFASGRNSRGGRGTGAYGNKGGRGSAGRGGRRVQEADRVSSLTVSAEWVVVEEFDLSQLLKLAANAPKAEDLVWAGYLDQYNDSYEKVNSRTAKNLMKLDNKVFYSVTTKDDPIMESFLVNDIGDIFATDAIIAHLVAAPRSKNSWDIVIEKTEGKIFMDKRENCGFDLLSVSETAVKAPNDSEEFEEINHPGKLSIEATAINQNFSQQVLIPEATELTRKQVFASHYYSHLC